MKSSPDMYESGFVPSAADVAKRRGSNKLRERLAAHIRAIKAKQAG